MNQIMSSEKGTSIEMINNSNIYPIIRGEISETDAQAQPCDTQTISSYHDIDETNSDNEMLKAQPLKVVCPFSNVFVSRIMPANVSILTEVSGIIIKIGVSASSFCLRKDGEKAEQATYKIWRNNFQKPKGINYLLHCFISRQTKTVTFYFKESIIV